MNFAFLRFFLIFAFIFPISTHAAEGSFFSNLYCKTVGSWISDISCAQPHEEETPVASTSPNIPTPKTIIIPPKTVSLVEQAPAILPPTIHTPSVIERIITQSTDTSSFITKDFFIRQIDAVFDSVHDSLSDLSTRIDNIDTTGGGLSDLSSFDTDDLTEGSNLYFTDARVASYISGSSTVPHVAGGAYGDLLFWNNSSWSTIATSSLGITGGGYGDTNVNSYIHASSTIPKTYTTNVFTGLNTFSSNVGIGTTTPWGLLSVNPNGISGPSFVVGSSTATNFMIGNDGNTYLGSSTKLSYSVLSAPSGHLIMDDLRAFSMRNKSGGNGANIYFWTDHDSNGGELILNSAHNIALVPGVNGNLTGNIQIGNTSATNDTITFQRNGTADSGTLTTASKKILFANSYWNGSAVVYPYLSMRSLVTNTGFQSLNWYYDDPGTNSPSNNAGIGTQMATLSSTGFSAITINATSTATSTFAGSIAVTENATSTFAGGIDISTGCFAVSGVCVTGTGSSYGNSDVNSYIHASTTIPKTYTANTFSALQTIPYASTTMISSSIASTSQLIVEKGTTFLTPTISFSGDSNMGIYSSGADILDFVTSGTQQWQVLSSGTLFAPNGDGVSTSGSFFAGGYSFSADADSSFSRISDGVLGITNNSNTSNYYFSANRTGFGSTTPLARLTASSSIDITAIFDQRGTSDILQLQDSGQSVFVVKDGGNVGIATTSPWRTLSVAGTVAINGLTGSTGAGSVCLSASNELVYNSGSDACLPSLRATKHDINNLDVDALSIINQLQPSTFVYNDGDQRVRYGFMAEDTRDVDEHLVTYSANGELSGIDDRAMTSLLVKALKQLNEKIQSILAWFSDGKFRVQNDICVDDVCITKEQFKALLLDAGGEEQEPVDNEEQNENNDDENDNEEQATTTPEVSDESEDDDTATTTEEIIEEEEVEIETPEEEAVEEPEEEVVQEESPDSVTEPEPSPEETPSEPEN